MDMGFSIRDKITHWVKNHAKEKNIPPYYVLQKGSIDNLCDSPPKTIDELYEIKGIGLKKIKTLSIAILKLCSGVHISDDDVTEFIQKKQTRKRKSKKATTNIRSFFEKKQMPDESEEVIDISTLSASQREAFNAYRRKENILITGPAGTGKTHIIRSIVQDSKLRGKKIQCCALTGCAALLLECYAKTVHSWAGIGLMSKSDEEIIFSILQKGYITRRWKTIEILIIDEVSMMSERLFGLLDKIGRATRHSLSPFGGIQVILSGDFYQLPPVNGKFCFTSDCWTEAIQKTIVLGQCFRQTQKEFTKILNQIRKGRISRRTYERLLQCIDRDTALIPQGLKPTIILPRKKQSDTINREKMISLEGDVKIFPLQIDRTNIPLVQSTLIDQEVNGMVHNGMFDETLSLKEGAQVMCIANLDMDNGICNGSLGKVIGFERGTEYPIVQFTNGYKKIIGLHTWQSETIKELSIQQIPLILAWSCTIHKIQGATLDLIEVDVGSGVFECGQTYVALSRVKTLDGLYLRSFDPHRITVHKSVQMFYENCRVSQ